MGSTRPTPEASPAAYLWWTGRTRSRALAARFGDEYNAAFLAPEEAADLRGRLDDACRGADRDPATLPLSMMTLVAVGRDDKDAENRLSRMLSSFRVPQERCVRGVLDHVESTLRELEAAGVKRIYSQHPDREDFTSIQLLGELAARLGRSDSPRGLAIHTR